MKYKCAIFDLDGTLLDSLRGILNAVNKTFKDMGFNIERTYEESKYFIGAGAIVFAQRAMKGQNIPIEKETEIMKKFLENYAIIQALETKPFDGIVEMLDALQNEGMILCIASNKPQILLEPIVKQLFPGINFAMALGQRPNKPEKPDPFCIFEIINGLKLEPSDCVYVGDSEYDYKTAHNAGIDSIICKYGYGFYDQEWFKKPFYKVESVNELKEKLLSD